ncbi:hypothetical protein YC2023_078477 [Brassica napus]
MTVVGGIDGYGPLSSDPTSLKRMRKEKEKQNLDLGMSRDEEDEEKGAGIHFGKS